jgi:hypothetical protein
MTNAAKVPIITPMNAPFNESRVSRVEIVVLSTVVGREKLILDM